MAILVKPVDIFVEFLRTVYKEPARTGLSKRHTTTSQNFTATAGQTTFTVTSTKLLCVNSVTVNSVAKYKYTDYNIDLKNNQIVLVTGATVGHVVAINYDYGTVSWINSSNVEKDTGGNLTRSDYPRVIISQIGYNAQFMGFNSDSQISDVIFQVDISTKEKLKASDYVRIKTDGTSETISETSLNQDLIDNLMFGIISAIRRKWRTDLIYKMFFPVDAIKNISEIRLNHETGLFSRSLDINVNGFNLGERT